MALSALDHRILDLKQTLARHPLYERVADAASLRVFTERHVLCVLDFMSLLKSLQRDLTCVEVPWVPARDAEAAWLINSIVVDEESDELPDGRRASHFEWYLEAMDELGADTGPVTSLVADLRRGTGVQTALDRHGLPPEARAFMRRTLAFLPSPLHVRAAVFFHGREDVIPRMFLPLVERLAAEGLRCDLLEGYLRRHIEADGEVHGPKAVQLLGRLFAGDAAREREAKEAAIEALEARVALWDAVLESLGAPV